MKVKAHQIEMDPVVREILHLAIRAPSGDNVQPWKFRVQNTRIQVFHNPEKECTVYDVLGYPGAFALGALIENIRIAAASRGLMAHISIPQHRKETEEITTIMLEEGTQPSREINELAEAIKNRCTNRKPYKKTPLSEDHMQILQTSVSDTASEVSVEIIKGPNDRLARAVSLNEQLVFQNQHLHKPFFSSIRWSDEAVQNTRDGFSIDTFELPLPGYLVFKMARNWDTLSLLNRLTGLAKALPAQTAKTYAASGGYVACIANSISWDSYFSAGQIIENIWLTATKLGLSFQPITGIIFLRNIIKSGGLVPLTEEEKKIVLSAYRDITDIFSVSPQKHILFAARLGQSETPTSRTARKNLEELLI